MLQFFMYIIIHFLVDFYKTSNCPFFICFLNYSLNIGPRVKQMLDGTCFGLKPFTCSPLSTVYGAATSNYFTRRGAEQLLSNSA